MNRSIAKGLVLLFLISALLPLNVASQTPTNPITQGASEGQFRLKTNTEVVLVNVTVRDKNGEFIKNLKADDFSILEDGKKQSIISIDAENTDGVVTAASPAVPLLGNITAAPKPPSITATPATPLHESDLKDRRLIVLFFDLGSMQPQEVGRAASSARDYIDKQMAPADLVSIVTLSNTLDVAQDFTSEKEPLKTVLNGLDTGSNEALGDAAAFDTTGNSTDASTDAAAGFTPDETEYNIFNTDRRLQALTNIADDLSGIQQRKSVIYFAAGMQRTGMENQTQLRLAINAATRANLSFYTVDVRGLEAMTPGGAVGGSGQRAGGGGRGGGVNAYSGQGMLSQYDTNFASQETLATLANDTGGKAFLDTNDFAPAFTKVQQDTSFYYLLGYISNNPARDGKFRQITVRLNRPDLKDAKLEYRRGYYAPADFQHSTKETREQQLRDQLTSDLPSSDFPVYVSTGYFRLGDNRYFVPVSLVVPGSQIPFTRASEKDRATLDLIGVVRDESKRPFGQLRDTVQYNVNTSQEIQRKNVQYDGGFLLPPGKYTAKFVVRENQTGRTGSFEATLIVPDLKNDPVKVSSIVVSNQKQPAKAKNNPLVREGSEIVPNVTHVFSSNQHLFLYYEVYDPAKTADAADKATAHILTNVALYKGSVKVYETSVVEGDEINVPDRKAAGFELDVALTDLKPGFYTCQINVIDDAAGKFVFPRLALLVR